MHRTSLLALALALPVLADTTLYVASNGSDSGSGTLQAPFATLVRARDEIRRLKPAGPVTVYVRGGTYEMPATLQLTAQDSGTADAPIVYRAYRQEKPVLTAAHAITGFVPYKGKILKADARGMSFRQLFYNHLRQPLARYPNYDAANPYAGGWSYADGKQVPMYTDVPGEDKHTLQYRPEDAREWAHPEDAEVMVFPRYNWWNNIVRIKSVDRENRTITLAGDCS